MWSPPPPPSLPSLFLVLTAKSGEDEVAGGSGLKEYHCPACDKLLHLTPVDILRHKRRHALAQKQS